MFREPPAFTGSNTVVAAVRVVARLVRGIAFWTAALLPLGYLPLLFAVPSRVVTLPLVGKLVTLNVVALLVGHGYRRDDAERTVVDTVTVLPTETEATAGADAD